MSKSTLPSARLSREDVARLRSQIVVTASCHLWMGSIGGEGYGQLWVPYPPQEQTAHDRRRGRVITPHAAASALVLGPLPEGSTHLHDCDVRICVSTAPGHVRRGTQRENVRQAVARGYLRGPRPGGADARGPAGASHAIQDAIRAAVSAGERDPAALARVLADMFAAGFPTVDVVPLFPEPAHVPAVYVSDFPVDLFAVPPLPVVLWSAASETVPLFQL
jgi:hypothetical protein